MPAEEFDRTTEWPSAYEQKRWDEQLVGDATSGKLDFLFAEPVAESENGLLREWPRSE